ncbi:MAG TPA: exopolysaccharide biosynthesis polyprenyl glycosylphosphotransferase [Phycisphaerae bacterium]|nr:exopolysaccharide biosynthesis polyprenyl glycosylphosphotransferase [Phycisphaerae bacterium]
MTSQFAVPNAVDLGPAAAFAGGQSRQRHRVWSVWGQMMLNLPPSIWMVLDVTVLTLGVCVGYSLFVSPVQTPYPHVELWQAFPIFSGSLVVASLVFGLYQRDTLLGRSRILTRMLLAVALAVVLTYTVVHVVMYTAVSRRVTGLAMGEYLLVGASIRMLTCWALQHTRRGLLIVGPGLLGESFARAAAEGFLPHNRLVGFVEDSQSATERIGGLDRLGGTRNIPAICRRENIRDIVVGSAAARDPNVMTWLLPCLRMGCRVTNEAVFYEKATGQILVDQITPHWFLFADLKVHCEEVAILKRAVDVVASIVGLLLTLPLLPLVALAIRLEDRGPVLYSQDRVGQNGIIFRLFKLRTMKVNSEPNGAVWATDRDPRVTRVGRVLRRLRLDELPQLYNVLLGQMSLVGPRPERPDIVARLAAEIPFYNERHLVKPGLTGWAQIGFRYGNTIEDAKRKLQFDLYYLKHMSFELDLIILFRTVGTFLRGAC